MEWLSFYESVPSSLRIVLILFLAVLAHFIVQGVRRLSQWGLTLKFGRDVASRETFLRRYPKIATLTTILVSAITFIAYFLAVGFILRELFNVSLTTYFASASVLGLAIGFGLQGLVQDVVIGLTLIFSDALNVEELVETSGQIGRVESIGLRFTTLVNLHGQRIFIPNRNIGIISRFRRGAIRAYVDIQIPTEADEEMVTQEIKAIAVGMHHQHRSIILTPPEIFGIKEAREGNWRYLRIKFRLWPGQTAIIENTFRQRVITLLKKIFPDYADWMVTVTYRVD